MENNNNSNTTSTKKNNTLWIVIAVIIILAIGWWAMKPKVAIVTDDTAIGAHDPQTTEPTEDLSAGSETTVTGTAPVSMSYAAALIKYKDARIQLNTGTLCDATPNNVTYKNGTSIMIDNRAPVARTIKIGAEYSVKPYGFKIIKLTSSTLPMKYLVDCGKQQNVATILLQK